MEYPFHKSRKEKGLAMLQEQGIEFSFFEGATIFLPYSEIHGIWLFKFPYSVSTCRIATRSEENYSFSCLGRRPFSRKTQSARDYIDFISELHQGLSGRNGINFIKGEKLSSYLSKGFAFQLLPFPVIVLFLVLIGHDITFEAIYQGAAMTLCTALLFLGTYKYIKYGSYDPDQVPKECMPDTR